MADIHKDELRNVIDNAESFLKSSMTSPIGYPGQEALVYMISRGHNCDDAIQEVKERWKSDAKARPFGDKWRFWCHYDPYVIFHDAAMLRTAGWCGIGGDEDYWKYIYEDTEHYHSDYRELDFFPFFPYFRSKKLITNMLRQLEMTLAGYVKNVTGMHDWKDFFFKDEQEYDFQGQYYVNTLQIATLIFGAHQIQSRTVDSEFLAESTEYLLKSQLNNGSWWDDSEDERTVGVYQACIAVHALCMTKPTGYEHCVRMAKKWLLTQQHTDGYWEDINVPCKFFLTVLVLDALELAGGGKRVTFSLPAKVADNGQSKGKLTDDIEQGKIIVRTSAPIYLQHLGDSNECIQLDGLSLEDIKRSIKLAEHELLDDKINVALVVEFQKYESKKRSDPKAKRPSYRKLAKILCDNKLTPKKHSAQTISKWVKKLIEANLITDYFAEMRREFDERSSYQSYLDNKKHRNSQ